MQIAKWGNSLAVRLPAELVRKLDLKEGDDIELYGDKTGFVVMRQPEPQEILDSLKQFRGRLSAEQRLSREEANER